MDEIRHEIIESLRQNDIFRRRHLNDSQQPQQQQDSDSSRPSAPSLEEINKPEPPLVYNFPYEDRINLEPTVSQPNFHSPPPDYPPPPPVLGPKPNLTKISSPRKIFSRDDVIRQTSPPAFLHQNLGSKASSLPPKPIKKPPRAPPPIPSKPSTMPDLVPNLPPLQKSASARPMSIDDCGYLLPEAIGIPTQSLEGDRRNSISAINRVGLPPPKYPRPPKFSPTSPPANFPPAVGGTTPPSGGKMYPRIPPKMSLPNLREREASGSLPNIHPHQIHSRKFSSGNLSLDSSPAVSGARGATLPNRPLPATPPEEGANFTRSLECLASPSRLQRLDIERFPWYQTVGRKEAEVLVSKGKKDGMFLIRDSESGSQSSPFSLTLFYQGRVYHLNIRVKSDGNIALGKKKPGELVFSSIVELVKRHKYEPLKLTAGKSGESTGRTILSDYPKTSYC